MMPSSVKEIGIKGKISGEREKTLKAGRARDLWSLGLQSIVSVIKVLRRLIVGRCEGHRGRGMKALRNRKKFHQAKESGRKYRLTKDLEAPRVVDKGLWMSVLSFCVRDWFFSSLGVYYLFLYG
ncbi:hypothetical protein CEXT_75861 [Caerostris extrusa]|uniref:Uncharacterized protein n=1 Tax=Caerostris extrusa TaxID=172846 RepID=A0AAV4WYV0_CAEEX|nr:hypothetical protein CEXT_75861 [Caerostris extrusa]